MSNTIENNYHKEVAMLNDINSKHKIYAYVPRHLVEVLCFFIIVVSISIGTYSTDNIEKFLPTITLFILAILKISHILMRMSNIINTFKYTEAIIDTFNTQEKNIVNTYPIEPVDFKRHIYFKNVTFIYRDGAEIFRNINWLINKGDKIGIMGVSGIGKTTLLDVLMGF